MKKFLSLFLIFISMNVFAQTTDSTFVKKKHTIGIGGFPLHVLFVGEGSRGQDFNLSYKRQGKKINFRSSFNYFIKTSPFFDSNTNDMVLNPVDSSMWLRRSSDNSKRSEMNVRIGLEKNWIKKRSTFLFGIDLLAGIYNTENSLTESYFPEGTNFEIQPSVSFFSNSNFIDISNAGWMVGISPVLGWEYQINKRFGVSAQYRPSFRYRLPTKSLETRRENIVDGIQLQETTFATNELPLPQNSTYFDSVGFDLFLTYNF